MELDQVDEDRPEDAEEQALLVLLQLGVEPVDDLLAGGLGADLAVEQRLQGVELAVQPFAERRDRRVAPDRGRVGAGTVGRLGDRSGSSVAID